MYMVSKADWKLFQNRVGQWQERYMGLLCKEYVEILSSDKASSERFWAIHDRIKEDKKSRGVLISLEKKNVIFDIAAFINENIITFEDLEGFSEETKDEVKRITELW